VLSDETGVQALRRAEPIKMPTVFRNSRRERYCEYEVISEDGMGSDSNCFFMLLFQLPDFGV
jgi:hypothetical protein